MNSCGLYVFLLAYLGNYQEDRYQVINFLYTNQSGHPISNDWVESPGLLLQFGMAL